LSLLEQITGKITPESIVDYIYSILHSPSYREKYKEFLKIDFPRVPYPKDAAQFDEIVKKGQELRELHLMQSSTLDEFITSYPREGDNAVEKIEFKDDKVYINQNQYFGKVSKVAWNFYIGGYQPAQKWLKDRKGRVLTNEDIEHYQKIIKVLSETDRIMKEIDRILQVTN
jgi:predicted helicase